MKIMDKLVSPQCQNELSTNHVCILVERSSSKYRQRKLVSALTWKKVLYNIFIA